jgi:hypothetical protein
MTRRLWWVAPGALALAWLLTLTPGSATVAARLFDLQLLVAWPAAPHRDVAVVEIDDASVRALQVRWGAWPYAMSTHAALAEFLLEQGARAVVLDVPLPDATDHQGPLPNALGEGRLVLGLRRSGASDAHGRVTVEGLQPPGRTLPAHWPRSESPAWSAPVAALAALEPTMLGVSGRPDVDGQVARWPLVHQVHGRGLPALPLAAVQATEPGAPLRYADGAYALGAHRWPVDAQSRATLPRVDAESVPRVGFLRVGAAASGITEDPALRKVVAGRVVFVGRSTAAEPTTPQLAAATAALSADRVLRPGSWTLDTLLVAIALLPAVALWRRGATDGPLDALLSAGAAGTLLMVSTLALAVWHRPSHAMHALAVCAAVWLLTACAARRAETRPEPAATARGATSTRRVTRSAAR